MKVLLTGRPGSGKTTAIRQALQRTELPAGGFYTEEVREAGRRVGFRLVTLDGQAGMLAEVGRGGPRIGRYGVDLQVLEDLGVASMRAAMREGLLVVVDEIGPMELLSRRFQDAAWKTLRGASPLLATIMQRSHPVADRMKAAPGVTLLEIGPVNRGSIVDEIVSHLTRVRAEG